MWLQISMVIVSANEAVSFLLFIFYRLSTNPCLRKEPKHVVFLTQLLLLFRFCHLCKADNPSIESSQVGSMVVIKATCSNPACNNKQTWRSQPFMPGTKIAAGNFLLSFAILLAGGSASKTFQIFSHMGLACISLSTFFKHQRVSIDLNISKQIYNYLLTGSRISTRIL